MCLCTTIIVMVLPRIESGLFCSIKCVLKSILILKHGLSLEKWPLVVK